MRGPMTSNKKTYDAHKKCWLWVRPRGLFVFEISNQILRSGLLPCLFLVLQNQWILAGCVILQPCISIWQQCAYICWSCQQRKGQEQYGMLSISDNVCLCCLFCNCLTSTPLIIVLQEWWFDWGFADFLGFSFFHVIMVSTFFQFSLVRFSGLVRRDRLTMKMDKLVGNFHSMEVRKLLW
jgi:hypothetical protein